MTDSHHPPRWRIALVREPEGPRFTTDVLRTSADVAHAFAFLADPDREEFWLAALDQRHRIIGTHQVSVGTLTASLVHPREVVKVLVLCSAAAGRLHLQRRDHRADRHAGGDADCCGRAP